MNLFENIEKLINNHDVEYKIDKEEIKSRDINLSEDEIDLANKLGVTSGSISNQLNKLEDLMFIEINDEKKYSVCDSVFKVWLNRHYEKYGFYPHKYSLNLD